MMTTTVMIKPNQTNPTKCQGQEQKKVQDQEQDRTEPVPRGHSQNSISVYIIAHT